MNGDSYRLGQSRARKTPPSTSSRDNDLALRAKAPWPAPAIWRARARWRSTPATGLVLRRPVAGFVSAADTVPETNGGPVEAVLETWYRSGGKGGDPRAMLSAGNLNTAALTLFLALHLSVSPDLPWLVIDDPVQSMDEVHIAQFTALLRTLAKLNLQRQIIIAVHEKPLFDYLSLELSPAFHNDRLITIELSRSADGQTLMNYLPHVLHLTADA